MQGIWGVVGRGMGLPIRLTVNSRRWVAKLPAAKTVGSGAVNAIAALLPAMGAPPARLRAGGWGRYRLGHPAVGVALYGDAPA